MEDRKEYVVSKEQAEKHRIQSVVNFCKMMGFEVVLMERDRVTISPINIRKEGGMERKTIGTFDSHVKELSKDPEFAKKLELERERLKLEIAKKEEKK